jgi:hypothetical protein
MRLTRVATGSYGRALDIPVSSCSFDFLGSWREAFCVNPMTRSNAVSRYHTQSSRGSYRTNVARRHVVNVRFGEEKKEKYSCIEPLS